eukprot:6164223-Prymnesium_polylepis.1
MQHHAAARCGPMRPDAVRCARCVLMRPDAARCARMRPDAVRYCTMLHVAPVTVAAMRHDAACATIYFVVR